MNKGLINYNTNVLTNNCMNRMPWKMPAKLI